RGSQGPQVAGDPSALTPARPATTGQADPLPKERAPNGPAVFGYGGPAMRRAKPVENRVTPTGAIVSDPARGLLMGNRGCLHGPDRRLGAARWRSELGICWSLHWMGVRA